MIIASLWYYNVVTWFSLYMKYTIHILYTKSNVQISGLTFYIKISSSIITIHEEYGLTLNNYISFNVPRKLNSPLI